MPRAEGQLTYFNYGDPPRGDGLWHEWLVVAHVDDVDDVLAIRDWDSEVDSATLANPLARVRLQLADQGPPPGVPAALVHGFVVLTARGRAAIYMEGERLAVSERARLFVNAGGVPGLEGALPVDGLPLPVAPAGWDAPAPGYVCCHEVAPPSGVWLVGEASGVLRLDEPVLLPLATFSTLDRVRIGPDGAADPVRFYPAGVSLPKRVASNKHQRLDDGRIEGPPGGVLVEGDFGLSRILQALVACDRLNVIDLAGAELALRRPPLLDSVGAVGTPAAWGASDYFMGVRLEQDGGYLALALRQHVVSKFAAVSADLRERRKAAEAKAVGEKGTGKGDKDADAGGGGAGA